MQSYLAQEKVYQKRGLPLQLKNNAWKSWIDKYGGCVFKRLCQQKPHKITSGAFFCDSPYKNRLPAKISTQKDKFWQKFSIFGQWGEVKYFYYIKIRQISSDLHEIQSVRSKIMSVMYIRKKNWSPYSSKGVFGKAISR